MMCRTSLITAFALLCVLSLASANCGGECSADRASPAGFADQKCASFDSSSKPQVSALLVLTKCSETETKGPKVCCCVAAKAVSGKKNHELTPEDQRYCYDIVPVSNERVNKKSLASLFANRKPLDQLSPQITGLKVNDNKDAIKSPAPKKVITYPVVKPMDKTKASLNDIGFEIELKYYTDSDQKELSFFLCDPDYAVITEVAKSPIKFKVDLDANAIMEKAPVCAVEGYKTLGKYKWIPEISFLFDKITAPGDEQTKDYHAELDSGLSQFVKKLKTANEREKKDQVEVDVGGAKLLWTPVDCEDKKEKVVMIPGYEFDQARMYWQSNLRVSVSQFLSLLNVDYIQSQAPASAAFKDNAAKLKLGKEFLKLKSIEQDVSLFHLYVLEVLEYLKSKDIEVGNDGGFKNPFGLFPKVYPTKLNEYHKYDMKTLTKVLTEVGLEKYAFLEEYSKGPDLIAVSNAFTRGTPKLFDKDGSFIAEIRDFTKQATFSYQMKAHKLVSFSYVSGPLIEYLALDI